MLLVKQFREERGIGMLEAVSIIKEIHPGMDKPLLCKVENPDKYGVRLTTSAEQALEDAFTTTAPKVRKPDKRRKPMRIQCRLSKGQFELLQQALNKDGYTTMQEGISALIERYLHERHV